MCSVFSKKFFVCIMLMAADRAAKLLAVAHLSGEEGRFLTLHFNRGISFSLFSEHVELSLAVSIAAAFILGIACLVSAALRKAPGMAFIWAGALGNLADRLVYGYVIDWLPVAGLYVNLADIWLCFGCFQICVYYLRGQY